MKLLFAVALLLPALAYADSWLTANLGSHHFERKAERCEVNPGLGLERDVAKHIRGLVGLYHNSDCRPSGYLGIATLWGSARWKAGSAFLAFTDYHEEKKDASGQKFRQHKTVTAPALILSYEGKEQGMNLGFIPPDGGSFKGVIFVQWKAMRW